jgi:hypothetical protein
MFLQKASVLGNGQSSIGLLPFPAMKFPMAALTQP